MGDFKIKKLILLLLGLFVFSNLVYSLDCQYTTNESYSELVNFSTVNGVEYGKPFIEISNFQQHFWKGDRYMGNSVPSSFRINNNYKIPITVHINYIADGNLKSEVVTVKPLWYQIIKENYPITIIQDSIEFKIIDPSYIKQGSKEVVLSKEVCRLCEGNICINDGEPCSSSNECGGGYCVRGICTNSDVCFNNDCKCSSDEIQCLDNKRCVKKGIIPMDVKPECNMTQECITGYIDSETSLCAKSPAQLNAEKEQRNKFRLFVGIAFSTLFVIGMFIVYKQKQKSTILDHISTELDIKKIKAEYKKIQWEIWEKNKDIEELKAKTHKTKEGASILITLKGELAEQIAKFEKISKNFYLKKYSERYGNKIYLDTKGYIRFKNQKKLLHRYIYESFYNDFNKDNEVHHIDGNHYNNEIWNLIDLTSEQHGKIKHGRIQYGAWVSGIDELRRIGLLDNDFPEEVVKRLGDQ